ncbi:hypothetical protein MARINON1_60048 [Marinobacter salarius]|nr:hypothetical protein MBHK15_100442 [Marinobacter salarius]VXC37229.1 hypothetical protein MARINON1_60048 [Marinobacter salarius]
MVASVTFRSVSVTIVYTYQTIETVTPAVLEPKAQWGASHAACSISCHTLRGYRGVAGALWNPQPCSRTILDDKDLL